MPTSLSCNILIGLSAVALSLPTFASRERYVVESGDILSVLVRKKFSGRVWGKGGSLSRVLARNRWIKNQDRIYPRQVIEFSAGQPNNSTPVLSGPIQPHDSSAKTNMDEIESQSSELVITSNVARRAPAAEMIATPTKESPQAADKLPVPFVRQLGESGIPDGQLELIPYYALTAISSTDKRTLSSATLASKLNLGLDLKYDQFWSETVKSFMHVSAGSLSFLQPTDQTKTLQNASNFMTGLGVGLYLKVSELAILGIYANYLQSPFARSTSTGTVTIDTVSIPELGLQLDFDLVKRRTLTLGISGSLSETFQSTTSGYSVRGGTNFGVLTYLKHSIASQKLSLRSELGYLSKSQDTDSSSQTQTDLFVHVGFLIPFGGGNEVSAKNQLD